MWLSASLYYVVFSEVTDHVKPQPSCSTGLNPFTWPFLCILVDVGLCGEVGVLCKKPWPLSKWLSHCWRIDISLDETVSELKMQTSFGVEKNKIWTGCGICL